MGLKPQVAKYRASFSLDEVQELVTSIELAYPQGLSSQQLDLYNVYRKLKSQLVLANEGLLNPDYVTKPRDTLVDKLGFDMDSAVKHSTGATVKQTDEQAIASLEANFAKFEAASAEATRIVESGGKLPLLDNLLLDPAFKFGEDN